MGQEHWTEETRRAMTRAQDQARQLGDTQVCTEHVLLGVLEAEDPRVHRLLEHFHIPVSQLRQELESNIVADNALMEREPPLAPRVQRVMELAENEASVSGATSMSGAASVCPAHVLWALIEEGEGLAGRVLFAMGARQTEEARQLVAQP